MIIAMFAYLLLFPAITSHSCGSDNTCCCTCA